MPKRRLPEKRLRKGKLHRGSVSLKHVPATNWTCMCDRTFTKARKCLACGDDYPYRLARGEITASQKTRMSTEAYRTWWESRQGPAKGEVEAALDDLRSWVS